MPMTLNVGLSRKVGEANYSSRGASVNVAMELESSLALDTPRLRERIRRLFAVVRASLAEELNGQGNARSNRGEGTGKRTSAPDHSADQHPTSDTAQHAHAAVTCPRPATVSQIGVIHAMARKQRLDLPTVLQDRFHIARIEDLSIKQASELIDTLKTSNGG